jgi:hypothetical protein
MVNWNVYSPEVEFFFQKWVCTSTGRMVYIYIYIYQMHNSFVWRDENCSSSSNNEPFSLLEVVFSGTLQGNIFLSNPYLPLITVVWFIVFNVTFNNISVISWRSILLVEEIRVPGENLRNATLAEKLYRIMLYRVHFAWPGFELSTLVVIGTDCISNSVLYDHYHDSS